MYKRNSFVLFISICVTIVNAYWGDTNSGQYHIQTDEGPERYFRYQTDNGQFRKEKRLQDGTVIGTDAWIDASGYLRQKDYIADSKGYRILKSKTIFVGSRPIQEAMKFAKQSPAQAGTLVPNSLPKAVTSVFKTTTSTTVTPLPVIRVTQTPTSLGYDYPSPKTVFIRPHSQAIDSNYLPPNNDIHSTTTERPSYNIPLSSLEPPYANSISPITNRPDFVSSTPIEIFPPSTSIKPDDYTRDYGTPISVYPSTTVKPLSGFRSTLSPFNFGSQSPEHHEYSSTLSPFSFDHGAEYIRPSLPQSLSPSSIEGINNELLPPNYNHDYENIPQNYHSSTYSNIPILSSTIKPVTETIHNNNIENIQPLYNRPHVRPPSPYRSYQSDINNQNYNNNNNNNNNFNVQNLRNNYQNQNDLQSQNYPLYDGISQTENGFQYYLPRQYHEEEENNDTNQRTGSFGYIDPFGIRRVVYYNTAPGQGFQHRKNNRYVGFNAQPYDPKPPAYLRQEN